MPRLWHSIGFLLLAATLFVAAGESPHTPKATAADWQWLVGKWQGQLNELSISEEWKQEHEQLFTGKGFVVKGSDTLVREILRIEKIANHWVFIPVINPSTPVLFTLVEKNDAQFVFENQEHDYPQRVVYALEKGQLHAWIEGQINGQLAREDYWYKKLP